MSIEYSTYIEIMEKVCLFLWKQSVLGNIRSHHSVQWMKYWFIPVRKFVVYSNNRLKFLK